MNDDDLEDEIRGHLAIDLKERIERGEDPASARLAALKAFGNVTLTRDSMRGVWSSRRTGGGEALARDVRFALRQLWRSPGFTATALMTLAIGIGANTAIFTLVHAVLLKSLPVAHAGQLYKAWRGVQLLPRGEHAGELDEVFVPVLSAGSRRPAGL